MEGWEGATVIDYDRIIPYAADLTDLPMELDELTCLRCAGICPRLKAASKAEGFAGAVRGAGHWRPP